MSKDSIPCDDVLGFCVPVGCEHVLAYISRATCRAADADAGESLGMSEFLRMHRPALDQIVMNKIRAGGRSPVIVMARDLWRHPADLSGCADDESRHQ